MSTRFPLRVATILVVLGILFMPTFAAAQVAVGTLLGNVVDENGAAVPGATITATEVRTNISRTASSNEAGHPNGQLGNGNFGRVTSILPLTERVIRFGGRFLF
jgi:hypothetical protein